MKFVSIFCMAGLFACLCLTAVAQEPQNAGGSDAVQITADRLEADDATRKLVFAGNVVAQQEDITISSDRMTIEYAQESNVVRQIIAAGNVQIVQGERLASGQQAVYDKQEKRIVLTGNPSVKDGPNSVQGHEIILFLDGKQSIVKGGQDGRVKAVFQPGSGDSH
jgi:lipopolysaccharide export system protein LptA